MTNRDEVRSRGQRGQFIGIEPDIFDSEHFDIYEKMVYFSLRRFMNFHTGEAYPGVKRLAKMARCSERKVREAIKGLEDKGWIAVERRDNKTNLYLILDGPGTLAPAQRAVPPLHSVQAPPAQRADELDLYNHINNNYTVVFQRLYDLYLSKNIIQHHKPTESMKRAVNARLKDFTEEQLVQVINNCATVLHGHDYWFTHRYSFADLMREKDVLKFIDAADPLNNFRNSKGFGPGPSLTTQSRTQRPTEYNFAAGED